MLSEGKGWKWSWDEDGPSSPLAPSVGDLVLCDRGHLGVVTEPLCIGLRVVIGVHMTESLVPVLSRWESRNCCVLPVKLMKFAHIGVLGRTRRRGKSFPMPHLHLRKMVPQGWPDKMQYVRPSECRKIVTWLNENEWRFS